uniref:Lycopene cyclase family protein n=1 Tax=Roseihalotalea indica TaxID=2867963 RepID=A0AA49GNJ0_9BACT|nr:lycopene cyclase family protein [Tunicatimonas sp. TK19036]
MKKTATYDIIIAGGGCAGLSLVYHLLQSAWKDRSILIIDKVTKQANDRTWCFWETAPGPFEEIVHQHWQHLYFHGHQFSQLMDIAPYRYKMIRGIDFYRFVYQEIQQHNNVTYVKAQVQEITEQADGAEVVTEESTYQAQWVFSSLRNADEPRQAEGYQYLLQHFKGWEIRTPHPFFNPKQATLMDFRIDQHGECRFMYVLPTDEQTALVEFTLFSPKLLADEVYTHELQRYLQDYLQLKKGDYQILHEEFGVIPMTDMPYPRHQGKRIIRIGTAGGATKASTGYTFQRIQQDSQQLVQHLISGRNTSPSPIGHSRFNLFDSVLLNVMGRNLYPAKHTFTHLFQKNPPARVLKFLDENTHLGEDLAIMNSVPVLPFLKGTWHALRSL